MTAYWAGPLAGHVLALLGAEVIHLESPTRPDGARLVGGVPQTEERFWERGPIFAALNTNKKSLTIDLGDQRGIDLVRRFVATCDVVVENYTPRVLDQLGLDYETLRGRPTRSASCSACRVSGSTGRGVTLPAFAFVIEDASGLTWLTGHPDLLPFEPYCVGDPNAGLHALFGLMLALEHREKTGEGGLVEAAMVDAAVNVAAEQVIEFSAYGALLARAGNRGPCAAPQNLYQAAGPDEYGRDDCWVAIAVATDEQWVVAPPCVGRAGMGGRSRARDRGRAGAGARPDRRVPAGVVPCPVGRRDRRASVGCRCARSARSMQPHRQPELPQLAFRNFFEEVDHPGDRALPLQHASDAVLARPGAAARAARAAAR